MKQQFTLDSLFLEIRCSKAHAMGNDMHNKAYLYKYRVVVGGKIFSELRNHKSSIALATTSLQLTQVEGTLELALERIRELAIVQLGLTSSVHSGAITTYHPPEDWYKMTLTIPFVIHPS